MEPLSTQQSPDDLNIRVINGVQWSAEKAGVTAHGAYGTLPAQMSPQNP
jgi:hypothetical protein